MTPRGGTLAVVLHAHLPFVRHPEHADFLEEDWLHEAIIECYVPLLLRLEALEREGVPFRLALSLSPTLLSMLRDPLLMERCAARIERLVAFSAREVRRKGSPAAAAFYQARLTEVHAAFERRYARDLIAPFRHLRERGGLELLCCPATHAFLPLLQYAPEAVRAQISVGATLFRELFGESASGIWLPECGYYPGLDKVLAAEGIRYFLLDSHGLLDANPAPRCGTRAPVFTSAGTAAFGRDPASSEQVWSAELGYPGGPWYREFHRDLGFELDTESLAPLLLPTGERRHTGFKYWRVTSRKGGTKRPYRRDRAVAAARRDAIHFVAQRERDLGGTALAGSEHHPIAIAPFDAELFGHWWFEGPEFLEQVIRSAATSKKLCLATPSDYLRAHPQHELAEPALSSWGEGGYSSVWLDPSNDWLYRHLFIAARRMGELASEAPARPSSLLLERAMAQAARELLLAQSSDWAFLMKMGSARSYARTRAERHLADFDRLYSALRARGPAPLNHFLPEPPEWSAWLEELEGRDNLFPSLDYRLFTPERGARCERASG